MKRFTLTAAGLAAAAICGASSADISIQFATGPVFGGEGIVLDLGSISGTLTSALADIDFVNLTSNGSSAWVGNLLIGVSDGNVGGSFGGYDLFFDGFSFMGGWGSGANTGVSGFYNLMASNGGALAMNGTGSIFIGNGYGFSSGASYSGKITLKGLNAVPAPGALALVGLAGLRSRRRAR